MPTSRGTVTGASFSVHIFLNKTYSGKKSLDLCRMYLTVHYRFTLGVIIHTDKNVSQCAPTYLRFPCKDERTFCKINTFKVVSVCIQYSYRQAERWKHRWYLFGQTLLCLNCSWPVSLCRYSTERLFAFNLKSNTHFHISFECRISAIGLLLLNSLRYQISDPDVLSGLAKRFSPV